MPMKRLNLRLAIVLVLVVGGLTGSVYLLHGYQVKRTARGMLERAERASSEGNLAEAQRLYEYYLHCVPDDQAAAGQVALLIADEAEQSPKNPKLQRRAFFALEQAARRDPGNVELLGRLVDFTMRVGRFADAIEELKRLMKTAKPDSSLQSKLALCYIALERHPEAAAVLESAIQLDPTNVPAYAQLANLYRNRLDDPKQAEATFEQLIQANPKSPNAYIARSRYWLRTQKPDLARQDIEKATELDPDDLDVLLSAAELAFAAGKLDETERQLKHAGELFPDNERVLRAMVDLQMARRQPQEAIKTLTAVVDQQPQDAQEQVRLVELQLDAGDVDAARDRMKRIRQSECPPALLEYLEARLLMADGKWLAASDRLEKLQPQFASQARWAARIDLALGMCYERLGAPDRQVQAFQRVLARDPSLLPARIGLASALMRTGKSDLALQEYRQLRQALGDQAFVNAPELCLNLYQLLLRTTLQQPKDRCDWGEMNQFLETFRTAGGTEPVQWAPMKAEVLAAQGRLKEAYDLMASKCQADPKQARWWIEMANLALRLEGVERALEILDQASQPLGNLLDFRLARASWANRLDHDKALTMLEQLTAGVDQLPPAERGAMLHVLGRAYYQLQDRAKAQELWHRAADTQPENAPLRLLLFELAREMGDEKAMLDAADEIKRLRGSRSAEWQYVEAARRVWMVQNGRKDPELLAEAGRLLQEAQKLRPEWHELARLEAEIAIAENRLDDAISAFQRARELGPLQPLHLHQYVQLLSARQRFDEARELLAEVEGIDLLPALEKTKAELELRSGDVEAATATAKAAVADSDQANDFLWYGQLLLQAKKADMALEAFRRAVTLAPASSQARLLLILGLQTAGKAEEAKAEVEKLKEAIPANERPLALGQAYQLLGELKPAEEQLQAALAANPEDLNLLMRLATFYLQTAETDRGQLEKAKKQLQQVIDLASRDPEKNTPLLATARQLLAQVLANSGNWQEHRQALTLLEQNPGGATAPADLHAKAAVLAASPQRASRLEAIKLLEQFQRDASGLRPEEQARLAGLYEANGQWPACRDTMLNLLATHAEAPLLVTFLQMLFRHEATPQEITPWLDKLAALRPDDFLTAMLQARLLAKTGKMDQAVARLEAALPRPLPEEQLPRLWDAAILLEEFQQLDKAKQLLEEYAERKPEGKLAMAQFLARHDDADRAMQLCESTLEVLPKPEVIAAALSVLRQESQGGSLVPEHVARVDSWLEKALAEPEASKRSQLGLGLLLTGLRELEGRCDDLVRLYRSYLDRDDLTDLDRAPLWNNLAFALAVGKNEGEEALKLANQAIDALGPAPELLDTRAMAYLAAGRPAEALVDLREAIDGSPNGVKYFHLALAHEAAGDHRAAAQALKTAQEEYHLTATQLLPLERQKYEKLAESLKGVDGR